MSVGSFPKCSGFIPQYSHFGEFRKEQPVTVAMLTILLNAPFCGAEATEREILLWPRKCAAARAVL